MAEARHSVSCSMAIIDLSSVHLASLVKLLKEKEALGTKIEKIDESIAALVENKSPKAFTPVGGFKRRARRQRRGKLKQGILKLLASAGKAGLSVKELAQKLKAKPGSVSVWFYTTGKKIKMIHKVGAGRYALIQ